MWAGFELHSRPHTVTGERWLEERLRTGDAEIGEQEYFDKGLLIVAMLKAGVELAFETMVAAGMERSSP